MGEYNCMLYKNCPAYDFLKCSEARFALNCKHLENHFTIRLDTKETETLLQQQRRKYGDRKR